MDKPKDEKKKDNERPDQGDNENLADEEDETEKNYRCYCSFCNCRNLTALYGICPDCLEGRHRD